MKTLFDQVDSLLSQRDTAPLRGLLGQYEDEKELAKCYSTFAYLSCAGAGGTRELASSMGELIEAFYLATSVHDDALDGEDERLRRAESQFSPNTYLVLGDCFFVQMSLALSKATPWMPDSARPIVWERYERYLLDVAESQIIDERSQGMPVSRPAAIEQMRLRGGTWGRFCIEIPALAGGLAEDQAKILGDAGEHLFLALTVRDDLMDLRDDLQNGILTLAPALFLDGVTSQHSQFHFPVAPAQCAAFIDLLHSDGCIQAALDHGREYASEALRIVNRVLDAQIDMNWYLFSMLFRIVQKRFEEFTPDDVKKRGLGTGLSGLIELRVDWEVES